MAPKNKQKNAFYFFMKYRQQVLKEQGKIVPMTQMFQYSDPQWKLMTAEEKKPFEDDLVAYKRRRAEKEEGRLTSDGIPITELLNKQHEMEEAIRKMKSNIKAWVQQLGSAQAITEEKFYILCFNILCRTGEIHNRRYIPIEIGLVEYCIKDGISTEYHDFIDTGRIPTGYAGPCKEHSAATHQIPVFPEPNFPRNANYDNIFDNLRRIIGRGKKTVFVYCREDQMEQTTGCLDWLYERMNEVIEPRIVCWNLQYLLMELMNAAGQPLASKSFADESLSKSGFDFVTKTKCNFHEELDVAHCALGLCKRLCFMLSDILCPAYEVEPTLKHLPAKADEDVVFEETIPNLPPLKPIKPRPIPSSAIEMEHYSYDPPRISQLQPMRVVPSPLSEASYSTATSFVDDRPSSVVSSFSNMSIASSDVPQRTLRQPKTLPLVLSRKIGSTVAGAAVGAGFGRGAPRVQQNN